MGHLLCYGLEKLPNPILSHSQVGDMVFGGGLRCRQREAAHCGSSGGSPGNHSFGAGEMGAGVSRAEAKHFAWQDQMAGEWSQTPPEVQGRSVGGGGQGLGGIRHVGGPPDWALGRNLEVRCVGCSEDGQEGAGQGRPQHVGVTPQTRLSASEKRPPSCSRLGRQATKFSFACCRRRPVVSRFTAQKVFYISLEPETRVQPWPCLLRGRKPRDLVEGQNPLPEMRTEQPVQNLPLSSNTPFSGLSFLPVSQEPSLAWTLSTQSPQKRHLPSHWTRSWWEPVCLLWAPMQPQLELL